MRTKVTNQAEFDAALAANVEIEIAANGTFVLRAGMPKIVVAGAMAAVLLQCSGSSSPRVEAWGSSSPMVVAWDSSSPRVEARDSSSPRVVACGSSSPMVVAWDSSSPMVVAWDSSSPRVVARGSSVPWTSGEVVVGPEMHNRDDLFAVLDACPAEAAGVRAAIVAGKVDGTRYEGDCRCLVGTIEAVRGCNTGEAIKRDAERPAERLFMPLAPGMTPRNSPLAAMIVNWIDEWSGRRAQKEGEAEGEGMEAV